MVMFDWKVNYIYINIIIFQVGINRKRKLIQYTQYHGPDLCASIARNQKSSPSNCKKYKQTNEVYIAFLFDLKLNLNACIK